MKIKFLLLAVLFIVILSGCGVKAPKTVIMDYQTQEIITEFSLENHGKDSVNLMTSFQDAVETDDTLETEPEYSVLLKDKYSSDNDIWYKVYIENDAVYVQYDTEKMTNQYYDGKDDIEKCTDLTVDEFMEFLSIKE